jgi:hypothetical protein
MLKRKHDTFFQASGKFLIYIIHGLMDSQSKYVLNVSFNHPFYKTTVTTFNFLK